MQSSLTLITITKAYNEVYGEEVLKLIDLTIRKSALFNRFSEFEVNFILQPKMVDYLLLKAIKYNSKRASAYTFMTSVIQTALSDGISDVYKARRGDFSELDEERLQNRIDEVDEMQFIESPEVFINKIS